MEQPAQRRRATVAPASRSRCHSPWFHCDSGTNSPRQRGASLCLYKNPRVNPPAFTQLPGVEIEAGRIGVIGSNVADNAFGFLAGKDLVFAQHAGVYGESDQQGVMGLSTGATGTGVYGGSTAAAGGSGIGVRGETSTGTGVKGVSFGNGVGVHGESKGGNGLEGTAHAGNASGVFGSNDATDPSGVGVGGFCVTGVGVRGESTQFHGVAGAGHGSDKNGGAGVLGVNDSGGVGVSGSSPNGIGVPGTGRLQDASRVMSKSRANLRRSAILRSRATSGSSLGTIAPRNSKCPRSTWQRPSPAP